MKVLILSVLCACAGAVAGSAVHWPGGAAVALSAPLVSAVIPGHTKAFGYSTTQYINSLPLSYQVGLSPQFAYQVPHFAGVSAIQSPFLPVSGATYYPASVFYPPAGGISPIVPSVPAAPGAPSAPAAPSQPASPPEQPAGDSDSAVIDAADISAQPQQQPQDTPPQSQTVPIPPASNFPSFPSLPQLPQGTFPQIPQLPGSDTIFPQIPQLPQIPQGSLPSLPQFPQLPSNPPFAQSPSPAPPSSFPAADSGDKGLNDEDTISVESA
ncbi:protein app1 [Manduca sexta]|uniref:protein app1 n=1 Tax=Manduca sexta TaxID=7130 RepID=UPI00188F1E47|nr:protein app1 [Manduca sexta]